MYDYAFHMMFSINIQSQVTIITMCLKKYSDAPVASVKMSDIIQMAVWLSFTAGWSAIKFAERNQAYWLQQIKFKMKYSTSLLIYWIWFYTYQILVMVNIRIWLLSIIIKPV